VSWFQLTPEERGEDGGGRSRWPLEPPPRGVAPAAGAPRSAHRVLLSIAFALAVLIVWLGLGAFVLASTIGQEGCFEPYCHADPNPDPEWQAAQALLCWSVLASIVAVRSIRSVGAAGLLALLGLAWFAFADSAYGDWWQPYYQILWWAPTPLVALAIARLALALVRSPGPSGTQNSQAPSSDPT
jgi:hypothetical protein